MVDLEKVEEIPPFYWNKVKAKKNKECNTWYILL
jgi:hypothetical protein